MNDRNSPAYRWWRNKVLVRDRYTCQDCGQISGYLDVHHIKSYARNTSLRYDPNNGVTLCLMCHGKKHGYASGFIKLRTANRGKLEKTEKRFIMDVDKALHTKLKALAEHRGVSIRSLVDEVMKGYLKKRFSKSDALIALKEEMKENQMILAL